MEDPYLKTHTETGEKTVLNGRTYSLYEGGAGSCKYIKIHGLSYPEMTELQEQFHHTYKPILSAAAMGISGLAGLVGGAFIMQEGIETLLSEFSANNYEAIITGSLAMAFGTGILFAISGGWNPYKKNGKSSKKP